MPETETKHHGSMAQKFLGQVLYTGTGVGFTIVFATLNTIVLARYLDPKDYGIYLLMLLVTDFFAMISAFGLNTSIIPSIAAAEEKEKASLATTVITFRILTLAGASALFFLVQDWVPLILGGTTFGNLAILAPLLLASQGFRNLLRSIMQGHLKFKRIAAMDFCTSFLNFALIMILAVLLHTDIAGLLIAQIVSQVVACAVFYVGIPGPKSLGISRKHLRESLKFGWPLQVNDGLNFIFGNAGSILVASLIGPAQVALLAIAVKLPTIFRRLFESFRSVYLPSLTQLIATSDKAGAQALLNNSLRLIAFITASASVVSAVLGKELIELLFSRQYVDSTLTFIVSMVAVNLALTANILGTSLLAAKDSKGPTASNLVGSVVHLVVTFGAIPFLGIVGAALAGVAASMVSGPINAWRLRKHELSPEMREYAKIFIIQVVFVVAALLVTDLGWVYRLMVVPCFLATCYATSIFKSQDVSFVMSLLGHKLRRTPQAPLPAAEEVVEQL